MQLSRLSYAIVKLSRVRAVKHTQQLKLKLVIFTQGNRHQKPKTVLNAKEELTIFTPLLAGILNACTAVRQHSSTAQCGQVFGSVLLDTVYRASYLRYRKLSDVISARSLY